jgi:2-hydroxychromene-2-carboxylate isomerase
MRERVEFFFDPICPWAYQASIWIRDVREQTGLEIDWRFFSLEEINRAEGRKHPWEREWTYGWSLMRVGAFLRREDPVLVDTWYAATGKALFEDGRTVFLREGAAEVAEAAGLGSAVVEKAIADPSTHDAVRADHDRVVDRYGGFGVPTMVFPEDDAVFGPNVVRAPVGAEAVELWDLVQRWRRFEGLYEMKTPKRRSDLEDIATAFEPYLGARRWQTIQKPAP